LWHSGDVTITPRPDGGVHLVGSVPLADAETVFRTVAGVVGPYLSRRMDFLHLPVPKDRTDADYFRPLARLVGFDETMLFLGLITMIPGETWPGSRLHARS
jgi:hypothetical protein